jgi:hypothetical protein
MSKSGHRKRLLRAINIGDKKLDTSQGFYNGIPLLRSHFYNTPLLDDMGGAEASVRVCDFTASKRREFF